MINKNECKNAPCNLCPYARFKEIIQDRHKGTITALYLCMKGGTIKENGKN
jgi:hypothetical protein